MGHSTRPIEAFIEMLAGHGVRQLIDIRTVPRSRHNPHLNEDALPIYLAVANIGYAHASGLGGFRPTTPDAPNAPNALTPFARVRDEKITYPFIEL